MQPFYGGAEFQVAFGGCVGFDKRHGFKIWRQRANLGHLLWRADEKVPCLVVEPSQGADYITNVGADTKLSHAPDVDSNIH